MTELCRRHGISDAALHEPGKPIQNAFIEWFNSRLREECLNEQVFVAPGDARRKIERWRHRCDCARPHSSLGYPAPEKFAASYSYLRGETVARGAAGKPNSARRAVPHGGLGRKT